MAFAKNNWTESTVITIGGDWAFAVGTLESGTFRIAKGKLSGANPETNAPISQGMKMNLKPKDIPQWLDIVLEMNERLGVTPEQMAEHLGIAA